MPRSRASPPRAVIASSTRWRAKRRDVPATACPEDARAGKDPAKDSATAAMKGTNLRIAVLRIEGVPAATPVDEDIGRRDRAGIGVGCGHPATHRRVTEQRDDPAGRVLRAPRRDLRGALRRAAPLPRAGQDIALGPGRAVMADRT